MLQLAAFVVVAGTLLIQGTTLPWLVRRLRLPAPSPAEDALQAAALITEASRAGLRRLDEVAGADDPEDVIEDCGTARGGGPTAPGSASGAPRTRSSRPPRSTAACGSRCSPRSATP